MIVLVWTSPGVPPEKTAHLRQRETVPHYFLHFTQSLDLIPFLCFIFVFCLWDRVLPCHSRWPWPDAPLPHPPCKDYNHTLFCIIIQDWRSLLGSVCISLPNKTEGPLLWISLKHSELPGWFFFPPPNPLWFYSSQLLKKGHFLLTGNLRKKCIDFFLSPPLASIKVNAGIFRVKNYILEVQCWVSIRC